MKILYIAQLPYGGTSTHRGYALERQGHELFKIDTTIGNNLLHRILNKITKILFKSYWVSAHKNREIRSFVKYIKYIDCVWVDKGLLISPKSLIMLRQKYPNALFIHYSPDDMLNKQNQTYQYLQSIKLYDLHVTTKSYNVNELMGLGAMDVLFVDNAYEPTVHKKMMLSKNDLVKYQADVSFIGAYEKERANSIQFLGDNGVKVKVWGTSWVNKIKSSNITIMAENPVEYDYAKVLNGSAINLCFLRKVNRDLQTTRSIEIPACGAFMLAERTTEHMTLFKEGVEADFFSDDAELLRKIHFYLDNHGLRQKIAEAGYNKCITNNYSNDDRVKQVVKHLKIKE